MAAMSTGGCEFVLLQRVPGLKVGERIQLLT